MVHHGILLSRKRNNLLTHTGARRTWKNLQVLVLSERSWNERVTHSKRQKYRDRKQLVVARGWGGIDYRQTWKNVWGDEL